MGLNWLIKWYGFQVYSYMIPHLYIALCVHHPKFNLPSGYNGPSFPFTTSPTPLLLCLPSYCCLCLWDSVYMFYSFVVFGFISHIFLLHFHYHFPVVGPFHYLHFRKSKSGVVRGTSHGIRWRRVWILSKDAVGGISVRHIISQILHFLNCK